MNVVQSPFAESLPCSDLSPESEVLYPQPFCPEAITPRRRTPFDWVVNLMAIALVAAVLLSALLQFVFLVLGLVLLAAILYGLCRLVWRFYTWQSRQSHAPPSPDS